MFCRQCEPHYLNTKYLNSPPDLYVYLLLTVVT